VQGVQNSEYQNICFALLSRMRLIDTHSLKWRSIADHNRIKPAQLIQHRLNKRVTMQTQNTSTSHNLYELYASLPNETQQAFLQELLQKQQHKIENMAFQLACKQAKDENEFLNDKEATTFIDSLPQ